jgi:hypothetical protein
MSKTIRMSDTLPIRKQEGRLIQIGRNTAVEVAKGHIHSLEGETLLILFHRFPRSPWWSVNKWVVEVHHDRVTFPDNLPAPLLARVINHVVGREVVRVREAAGCPQCRVHHGEWVDAEGVGLHCTLCGWIAGTMPEGHVQVGDRFWLNDTRIVVHPETIVRVVAAHNQVTALCAPSEKLWARAGELPKGSMPLRKVRSLLPDYEYIQVEVVALPPYFGPIPY